MDNIREIEQVVRDGVRGVVSDWAHGQISVAFSHARDKVVAAVADRETGVPIAYLNFGMGASSISAEITGFDVKSHALDSMPVQGGEVNTVMALMASDKILNALRKALSGMEPKEEASVPEEPPAVTPLARAIYEKIGWPKRLAHLR